MKHQNHATEPLGLVLGILLFYLVLEGIGITCPILFLTGISCAGCGMSRAWFSVLRLDFQSAFAYHPLFWVPPVFLVVFLLRNRIPEKPRKVLYGIFIGLFGVVWLLRMLSGRDPVVVFHPEQGLILRTLHFIVKGVLK